MLFEHMTANSCVKHVQRCYKVLVRDLGYGGRRKGAEAGRGRKIAVGASADVIGGKIEV